MVTTVPFSTCSRYDTDCFVVCIESLQAEKPIERESTLIIKTKSIRLSPYVRFSKLKIKNNFRWTNFINRKLILKKFFE